jgi:hypothetical protein
LDNIFYEKVCGLESDNLKHDFSKILLLNIKEKTMTNKNFFSEMPAITLVFVFGLVLAGCATDGGGAEPSQEEQAERLALEINAIEAGKATVSGDTVTLTGGVQLETALTVPEGVTLDLTADGAALELQDGAALTVNGMVNAKAEGINIDSVAASPATINGSGTIQLKSKGPLLGIEEGRKLTLDGVTLIGLPGNDNSVVDVGGEFVLKSGTITGNSRTDPGDRGPSGMGGGVFVPDVGTFTMEGGAITGNSAVRRGGGVCNGGTFIMKGGVIFDNSADIGGGVSNVDDGNIFIMEGGRIQGSTDSDGYTKNTATTRGAAMQAWPMAKWPTGGTYTKGGVSQTGGSEIVTDNDWTDDTLIAIP